MKGFLLSLIVLATVILLSFALPEDNKGKDHKTLIGPEKSKENGKFLQRRKPPVKIPGPALSFSEERPARPLDSTIHDEESKMKHLSDEDKGKRGKKDTNLKKYNKNTKNDEYAPLDDHPKNKKGNFLKEGRYDSEWKEETQEESSNIH